MFPDYNEDSALVVLWLSSSCCLIYVAMGCDTKLVLDVLRSAVQQNVDADFLVVCLLTQLLSQYP